MRQATCAGGLLLGLLALAGCSNGDSKKEDEPNPDELSVRLDPYPSQKIELPDFEHDWDDLERDRSGRRKAEEIARWATERHRAAQDRCFTEKPPAHEQGVALLEQVLQRVPTSSRSRLLLTQALFSEAAYWFRAADALAYRLDFLRYYRSTRVEGGRPVSEKELEQVFAQAKPYLDKANDNLNRLAREALKHLEIYRAQRPDDRVVLNFYWKLYFYLQDYQKALQWLNYLLRFLDVREVPEEDPARKDLTYIRERLRDYLANLEIQGYEAKGKARGGAVLPWDDKRGRALRERLRAE